MGKLIVNFDSSVSGAILPYDHQYMLYSSLLNQIDHVDSGLARLIHTEKTKPLFVMSQIIPAGNRSFTPDGIKADRFVLIFVSDDEKILDRIDRSFSEFGHLEVGPMVLNYHSSTRLAVPSPPTTPELVTRSPIILKGNGKYISFGDSNFSDILKSAILRKAMAVGGSQAESISFLRIVEGRRKAFTVHSAKIPCSIIKFIIDADRTILDTILIYGIGAKTQMGFGMIEVSR